MQDRHTNLVVSASVCVALSTHCVLVFFDISRTFCEDLLAAIANNALPVFYVFSLWKKK